MDFFLSLPLFFFIIVPALFFYCMLFFILLLSTIKFFSGSGSLMLSRNTMFCSSKTKNNTTSKGVEDHESQKSKKAAKKEQKKLEKQRHQQKATAAALDSAAELESDPLSGNYGDIPYHKSQSKEVIPRKWTEIGLLDKELEGKEVLISGRVQSIRPTSSKTTILVLRQNGCTVRCVVSYAPDVVSKQMVKYASRLNKESIVEVNGILIHKEDIKTVTQKVELQVREIYCICRAIKKMPVSFEDAICGRVHMVTRLDYRVLDMRTTANQAIFTIERKVENIFRNFLTSKEFVDIQTIAGIVYNDQPACLAQFPQLHKLMTVYGDRERVFEVGPVFRAEKSDTHMPLCEFIGLDVEMEIYLHYSEVIEIVDELFVAIFDGLNENCKEELEAVGKQFPFEPLKYLRETLVLPFQEGVKMLQIAGVEIGIEDDLNTEAQKKLGQLVLERYNTEFYILDRYPLKVRSFYTMPCYDDPKYSNSFDVFMRGEKIISGAQGIDDPELLRTRAKACGIDVQSQAISTYIDLIRYGVPGPHGGFGVGLEHVVMLFFAL